MTQTEYRSRASECVQMAQLAREPQRSKLLELAKAWLVLADDATLPEAADPPVRD